MIKAVVGESIIIWDADMMEESERTMADYLPAMVNLKLREQGLLEDVLHLMDLSLKTMAVISCLSYFMSDL
jgi:hypothetical protein